MKIRLEELAPLRRSPLPPRRMGVLCSLFQVVPFHRPRKGHCTLGDGTHHDFAHGELVWFLQRPDDDYASGFVHYLPESELIDFTCCCFTMRNVSSDPEQYPGNMHNIDGGTDVECDDVCVRFADCLSHLSHLLLMSIIPYRICTLMTMRRYLLDVFKNIIWCA